MSSIDDILANIPINSLADQLGVDAGHRRVRGT